jgi:hypothetical protein
MASYYDDPFLCNIYSDELISVEPEEFDEVQRLIAEERDGWQAYAEWAGHLEPTERDAALEQLAFEREQERRGTVTLSGARLLIKPCKCCKSSPCQREVRLGGIAL